MLDFRIHASRWVVTEMNCAPGCGKHVPWSIGGEVRFEETCTSQVVIELDCTLG